MTLQASGIISLNDVSAEFGGTLPHSLNEYYSGAGKVPASTSGIPSSGILKLSHFYGKSAAFKLIISQNQTELNLNLFATQAGWNGQSRLDVIINSGVYISSNSVSKAALSIKDIFPNGVSLLNNGNIIGKGGIGGCGAWTLPTQTSGSDTWAQSVGQPGGPALEILSATSITNNGIIAGGGGGGGSSITGDIGYWQLSAGAGGGGAGMVFGAGGLHGPATHPPGYTVYGGDGFNGTLLIGGAGNSSGWYSVGGAGGNLGAAGVNGSGSGGGGGFNYTGGAAGIAVSGNANVIWEILGDIRGPRV